jgi:hypothetical protein
MRLIPAEAATAVIIWRSQIISPLRTRRLRRFAGGTWNAGAASGYDGNAFGYDTIGFPANYIQYYRQVLGPLGVLPCTAKIPQTMYIVNNVYGIGNQQYTSHQLQATIDASKITVSKDILSVTKAY